MRMKRELKELRHLNNILMTRLKSHNDEYVISLDTASQVQGGSGYSASSIVPSAPNDPTPNDDDEPDDEGDGSPSSVVGQDDFINVRLIDYITHNDEVYVFEVSVNDWVNCLKYQIEGKLQHRAYKQTLNHKRVEMTHATFIKDYDIKDEDEIHLYEHQGEPIPFDTVEEDYRILHEVVIVEKYGERQSHTLFVPNEQYIENVKYMFQGLSGVRWNDQCFIYNNDIVEDWDYVMENRVFHVSLRIMGGGKRGANHVSSSGNPSAGAKTREEAMDLIEEKVGMALLRFNSHVRASPAITAASTRITQVLHLGKQPEIDVRGLLMVLNNESINKMMNVTTTSTRPEARCKIISDIIFHDLITPLNELKRQYDLAISALPMTIQFIMTAKFGDDSGGIGWINFMNLLTEITKEKARQNANANAVPNNGLGAGG